MLNGDGDEVWLAKIKLKNLAPAAHLFVHFVAVVLHVKLPSYKFYGGNVVCVPVRFFFTAARFHLGGRLHFSFSHRHY